MGKHQVENTTKDTEKTNDLLQKIYDSLNKSLQITQEKPYSRVKVETKLGKSTLTRQELDEPTITIENLKNVSFLKEISFVVDTNFSTKGKMVVNIDEVEFYTSKDLETFALASIQTITFDKGLRIKRDTKIEFFIWNAVDETEVRVGITLTYSD